jgi:hypothetical protein
VTDYFVDPFRKKIFFAGDRILSISPDEEYIIPPTAGSLGVYLRNEADLESTYALTAGHVARANPEHENILLYAPASTPFAEAKKSALVAVTRALKRDDSKRLSKSACGLALPLGQSGALGL